MNYNLPVLAICNRNRMVRLSEALSVLDIVCGASRTFTANRRQGGYRATRDLPSLKTIPNTSKSLSIILDRVLFWCVSQS